MVSHFSDRERVVQQVWVAGSQCVDERADAQPRTQYRPYLLVEKVDEQVFVNSKTVVELVKAAMQVIDECCPDG